MGKSWDYSGRAYTVTTRSFLLLLTAALGFAQPSFNQSAWTQPFTPHKIIGPVHYVGTADLACYLITSPKGHILINTGLAESTAQIRKNIETLGFKVSDVRILLTNQAHFDHVAGFAELQKQTGAKMMATEGDKAVLEDGGRSDFFLGESSYFAPVKVNEVLKDGQVIRLGDLALETHLTPGHTRGSVSYTMRVRENNRDYNVVFANIPTVIGAQLVKNPKYPEIAEDYQKSFRMLKALACDVFLAGHGAQYNMREKYKSTYSPDTFVDPQGFQRAIAEAERKFQDQLNQEQAKLR